MLFKGAYYRYLLGTGFLLLLGIVSLAGNRKGGHTPSQNGVPMDGDSSIPAPIALDSPEVDLPYPIDDPTDPTQIGNGSGVDLQDPLNIQNDVEYDPNSGTYLFNSSVGGMFDYRPPSSMSMDEYMQYDMDQSIQDNWQDITSENTDQSNKVIPTLNVKGLGGLFGSDAIDIRPQGTAELRFGFNTSRTDNPQLPERQRRITVFDFDQQIQLNVVGTIGDKLKLSTSYNTQATFDFENITKLEYTGDEDEIIQKIEAGQVQFPLNGALITGSQSLFGIKTELQFGRLRVTSIFSQQRGKRSEVEVAGGAQQKEFELKADLYEQNRHYFLSQYFRENYDRAMENLPVVNSQVNITRIEVWVTNINNTVDDTRNFVAFTDLGEVNNLESQTVTVSGQYPENNSNNIYGQVSSDANVRGFVAATGALASMNVPGPYEPAVTYEKVENARKLTEQEYTYNKLLGFISLNQSLNNDEVLAVAFQYTIGDSTYQVGEFSTDGVTGTDALILKLLKPTLTNPQTRLWDLMMKNVYSIGAYQVNPQNFQLDVWYNTPENSVLVPYLPYPGVDDKPLIQILELDQLNPNNAPYPDGFFDFVSFSQNGNEIVNGGTINPQNGRVFFTTIEPFGKTLEEKLIENGVDQNIIDVVVYDELYDSTQTAAQFIPEKNRFYLKGRYQSSVSSEISLNALNIPQGAVQVSAGGVILQENIDYTVDYNLGRVKIINTAVLESGQPVKVSVESNSLFNIQSKTLLGTRFDYRFRKDFNIGGTILNLTERPLTQKIDYGNEPISNTVVGLDGNYQKELPLLTKIIDKLPFLETKAKSTITANAEVAYLIPGNARAIGRNGTSYIDDFEGSQSFIDIRSFTQWTVASTPKGQPDLFPEGDLINDLANGYNRAKIAWYVIDPLFFRNNNLTPAHIKNNPTIQNDHRMREVLQSEVFPNQQLAPGTPNNIPVFDLAYYPSERGQYNFDDGQSPGIAAGLNANGTLRNPETRWGGIMRQLTTNNFEQANVEFIQFWVMDPFNADADPNGTNSGGDLYFNLGNISEDILADSRKAFENGIPVDPANNAEILEQTNWGQVPNTQVIVNAFDNNLESRILQDVGLDLLNNVAERDFYDDYITWVSGSSLDPAAKQAIINDPSADDYNYYRDDDYDADQLDILERYKRFNGMEGNSPTSEMSDTVNGDGYPTSASNMPNVEDINQDNNLSESESYYQYKVSIRKQDLQVGRNFVTDAITVTDPNGRPITWYQFKIPVREPEKAVNGIQDLRSIRFIRMFMKGFNHEQVLRFARLELVRGEWRRYEQSLLSPGEYIYTDPNSTTFNVSAVNVEQNGNRFPVNYVVPPGITREIDVAAANLRQLNEQSLSLEVCGLRDGDARAAFKNVDFDVRQYQKLKMFVHCEARGVEADLKDDDVTLFIRLGTDFENNYYEYELPLKVTQWTESDPDLIWPEANNVEIIFEALRQAKIERNNLLADPSQTAIAVNLPYTVTDPQFPDRRITVRGNPNLQAIQTIMIGVRNPNKNGDHPYKPDDGLDKCVEVWANEMRLTDFNNSGGWATIGRVSLQGADFMRLDVAGSHSTPNWGSIEKKVSERQQETISQFDMTTSFQLGKFFGDKAGIRLPFFFSYSVGLTTPRFDPLNPDIVADDSWAALPDDVVKERKSQSQAFTQRKAFNFTNVGKNRAQGTKPKPWDISNLSFTYSYNELFRRDINIAFNKQKNWRGGLTYTYNATPKNWQPFKNVGLFKKSKWFGLLKDFNVNLGPKLLGFNTDIQRSYSENLIRSNFANITRPQVTKNFNWVRTYDFKYDLNRNLQFNFNAVNNAIIGEPEVMGPNEIAVVNRELFADEHAIFKDSVMRSIRSFGTNMNYQHSMNVTLTLPTSQIPITDWITVNGRYATSYNWQRAPLSQDTLGNTIQNSRNISVNGQLNFVQLYNKIPYLRKLNQNSSRRNQVVGRRPQQPVRPNQEEEKDSTDNDKKKFKFPIGDHFLRLLMSVRNVSFTFSTNDGLLLPGYAPGTQYMGMNNFDSPGFGFIAGQQNTDLFGRETGRNYAFEAAANGWLIDSTYSRYINAQYTINHNQTFNARGTIEPFKGLRIDLTMDRQETRNNTSNFRWSTTEGDYTAQNEMMTGMLSYSTVAWQTSFEQIDNVTYNAPSFDRLKNARAEVSAILSGENPNSNGTTGAEAGYYDGYGSGQQDVVVGAFLAAYTGRNPNDRNISPFNAIPLPNWRVTFDALNQIGKSKPQNERLIQSFSITHGYRSNVALSNYTTNLQAQTDADGNVTSRDVSDNFISTIQYTGLNLIEQFSPLIGLDATWNIKNKGDASGLITKFELKKDRNISLSLTNNQITEIRGLEIVIGSGYRFNKVPLPFKIGGKEIESDLNLRVDVSIRSNRTITRKIIEDQNQITAGQQLVSIKSSADYQINKALMIRLYYDRVFTNPYVSTSFPTANTSAGLALRFTLQP